MRIISQIVSIFLAQAILEVIVMALLAKFGVPYMDFDSKGESVGELIIGIGYYYFLYKSIIMLLPYIALMSLSKKLIKSGFLVMMNIPVSISVTVLYWLAAYGPYKTIINPILGSLLAGFFMLFVTKIANSIKGQ